MSGPGFSAPYEALFLLPEAVCKSCKTKIPQDEKNCPKCGRVFKWSIREKIATKLILSYVAKEVVKEEAAAALREFKARKWCKTHGFQRTLSPYRKVTRGLNCAFIVSPTQWFNLLSPEGTTQRQFDSQNYL